MYLTINEENYEMSTKLIVAKKIESKFKLTIMQIFQKLDSAMIDELLDMVLITISKENDQALRTAIFETLDYLDLFAYVQEVIVRIMFSGTPEQNEKKLQKLQGDEVMKDSIREILGMNSPSTGSN